MKLATINEAVEVSGLSAQKSFAIKADAKMFKMLSSQLYSNKIRAVVRELSTNAYDAHVAMNKESEPFLVHLPNRLEHWFSVRDYGPGLSKDDVENLYTTYGESTKTNSNSYIGALGLGSKSPFAYTDTFSITSFFNGVKYSYSMYMDSGNCPSLVLLGEEDTNEPNGLEVSVSVKSYDAERFINEAKFVYSTFKVKPTIVGSSITFTNEEVLVSGSCWELLKGSGELTFIMGQVQYSASGLYNSLSSQHRNLLEKNIRIYLSIGEADINPSRESLSYDNQTVLNIKSKFDTLLKEIKEHIEDKISNAPTYWDACVTYKGLEHNFQNLLHNITYKGKKIEYGFTTGYDNSKVTITRFSLYNSKLRHTKNDYIYASEYVTVLFKDIHQYSQTKIREFLSNNNGRTVYLVEILDNTLNKKDVLDQLNIPNVADVSTLPSPPKVVRQSTPRSARPILYYDFASESIKNEKIVINAGELYCEMYRDYITPIKYNRFYHTRNDKMRYILQDVKKLGISLPGTRILFLKPSDDKSKINKHKLLNSQEFFQSAFDLISNNNNFQNYYDDIRNQDDITTEYGFACNLIEHYQTLKASIPTKLDYIVKYINEVKNKNSLYQSLKNLGFVQPTTYKKSTFSLQKVLDNSDILKIMYECGFYPSELNKNALSLI